MAIQGWTLDWYPQLGGRYLNPLSIRESFRQRNILVTGASGFVGKVWLAMLLESVPDTGHVYLVLRSGKRSAQQRLDALLDDSPVFRAVLARGGQSAMQRIRNRLRAINGDVSKPNLGIADDQLELLRKQIDLVVNLAGLVDFDPDVREAAAANVVGPLFVADFVRSCRQARLLHVSTAFVSGKRPGRIREAVETLSPGDHPLDAKAECNWLYDSIEREEKRSSDPNTLDELCQELQRRGHDCGNCQRRRCVATTLAASRLRASMSRLGHDRAQSLGWANTYTYSKSLAERLLVAQPDLQLVIFRPTIVESAVSYPFAGWNEGFNTSGPIIQLLGTWIRRVPVGTNKIIDLIPVDYVARGLMTAAAALLCGQHELVYQCGSSDANPIPVTRCVELSALAHRKHWQLRGRSWLERQVLSRWDARAVTDKPRFGLSHWRRLTNGIGEVIRNPVLPLFPARWPSLEKVGRRFDVMARKIARIEAILQIYEPFLMGASTVYECKSLARHSVLESEFRFEPQQIDWHGYMLDCHIPGLRKWCIHDSTDAASSVTG